MNQQALNEWLLKLNGEVQQTNQRFPNNLVQGWPLPFFGDILHARVLTVGVNPSDKEFSPHRRWDAVTNPEQWQTRLLSYFRNADARPWIWFETWSMCLTQLDLGYAGGAAHIDVSPRATIPMLDRATNAPEFRDMVEHDVKWFFQLLSKLTQVQLLLVAGPIPKANGSKQQLADFIGEQAGLHGAEWIPAEPLPKLVTAGHPGVIPVFVCPYEPGVDGLYAMVRQVHRNRELLLRFSAPPANLVPIMPARLDWPSAIGNFIVNFGTLDWHIQEYLEDNLPPEQFSKIKDRPFYERVERLKAYMSQADCESEKRQAWGDFFVRLEPVRELRNHIAHGLLRMTLAEDKETWVITLSLPRDLDGGNSPEARHLTFEELRNASTALSDLSEDFMKLFGNWVTDFDIRF